MSSAVVIPFPLQASAPSDSDRLANALQALQAALAEQQTAMKEWRFAMVELSIGVAGLGHSLLGYQENLGDVANRIETLRSESARLEAWADGVLQAS